MFEEIQKPNIAPCLFSFLANVPVHANNKTGADIDLQYLHRQRLGRALQVPYFFRGYLVHACGCRACRTKLEYSIADNLSAVGLELRSAAGATKRLR